MSIVPKAVIDGSGNVLNIVAYDTSVPYTPPAGQTLVDVGPGAEPGGTYANGVFTPAQFLPPLAGTFTRALGPSPGGYQVTSGDKGFTLAVTTGAADFIVSLPSAGRSGDGFEVTFRKADAGSTAPGAATSRVIVQDVSGNTLAWLSSVGDVVRFRADGTASWTIAYHALAPLRQTFNQSTSTGCVVPPLFTSAEVMAIGGGGGGGTGDRKATTAARLGGNGGGAAYSQLRRISAADILPIYSAGVSVPIMIGAGGAGAAALMTDNAAKTSGSSGGSSTFGTLLDSLSSALSTNAYTGSGGGAAYATSNLQGTIALAGLNGNAPADILGAGATQAQAGYGSGGTTSGTPPTAGTMNTVRIQTGASGGGGAAYVSGQAGQAGGNGGFPGGGGGGGAVSDNGFPSGAGGNGGGGQVRVTWYFGE